MPTRYTQAEMVERANRAAARAKWAPAIVAGIALFLFVFAIAAGATYVMLNFGVS